MDMCRLDGEMCGRELYTMNEMYVYVRRDRESRMYFLSMSGVCDVWVGERGEVKRVDGEMKK